MRGKSGKSSVSRSSTKDHPRLCGEKPIHFPVAIGNLGSPRLCGEKDSPPAYSCQHAGSPPPMRGKGTEPVGICPVVGITPAYAGKRGHRRNFNNCVKGSPRLCGEKKCNKWITSFQILDHPAYAGKRHSVSPFSFLWTGSPPPMRGKARCFLSLPAYHRITPRLCGEKTETASLIVRNQDHPRLCGGKGYCSMFLSPRA